MKSRIIVLTYNPGVSWDLWLESYKSQDIQNLSCLVIDSSSSDETIEKCIKAGLDIEVIPKSEFNHGGTRHYAYKKSLEYDIIIFMTQDAFFYNNLSISKILSDFDNDQIAISYGRQVPRPTAGSIESHARIFNYPDKSRLVELKDKKDIGFKVAFNSNSYSAYRVKALHDISGFPRNLSFGEDAYVAGKLLLKGWKIFYNSNSKVYHSHNYSSLEVFKRYIEIGKFHANNKWIFENFGKPEKEGLKFILSEIKFLYNNNSSFLIPYALFNSICKYLGYKIGFYS